MKLANLVDLSSPFDYLSIGFLHLNRASEGYFRLLKKQNIVVVVISPELISHVFNGVEIVFSDCAHQMIIT